MIISRRTFVLGTAAAGLAPLCALAQSARVIRLVVGFPPGGSGDVFARIVSQGLAEELGRTTVVDNRPGAGGIIAGEAVIRAEPDGATLIMHTGSSAITAPITQKVPPYNAVTDFAWIAHLSTAPFVIAAYPGLPVTDLQSLIAYIKARPGQLSYGHAGIGSTTHLAGEAFKEAAGLDIRAVPYRGSAPSIPDLMSGQITFVFETVGTLVPLYRAGKVKVLATFAQERSPIATDIPTAREEGVDLTSGTPNLLAAPPRTPQSIVDPVAAAIDRHMNKASVQEMLKAQGIQPILNSSPEKAKAYVAAEVARLTPLARKSGLDL